MKWLPSALILSMAACPAAAQVPMRRYPSCDLAAQHTVAGEVGGTNADPRQAHISARVNVLQADIGSARKARRLSQARSGKLFAQAERVRADADGFVRKQGFLSAAERASYDRELDAIAGAICRRTG